MVVRDVRPTLFLVDSRSTDERAARHRLAITFAAHPDVLARHAGAPASSCVDLAYVAGRLVRAGRHGGMHAAIRHSDKHSMHSPREEQLDGRARLGLLRPQQRYKVDQDDRHSIPAAAHVRTFADRRFFACRRSHSVIIRDYVLFSFCQYERILERM